MYTYVMTKANQLKKKGRVSTNFFPTQNDEHKVVDVFDNDNAIVFGIKDEQKTKYYYYYLDEDSLVELLEKVPSGSILSNISKEEENPLGDVLKKAGWNHYAKYVRTTSWWTENPYLMPEIGRRRILQEMYNPERGEFITKDDVAELDKLTRDIFDANCDEVLSKEEWDEVVKNKTAILFREDGKIVTYYVWKIEGKKLYSNLSVNMGPGNYLYDLERRVFEMYWEQGLRIAYGWCDVTNLKSLNRGFSNLGNSRSHVDILYNYISVKDGEEKKTKKVL